MKLKEQTPLESLIREMRKWQREWEDDTKILGGNQRDIDAFMEDMNKIYVVTLKDDKNK